MLNCSGHVLKRSLSAHLMQVKLPHTAQLFWSRPIHAPMRWVT